MPSVQSPRWNHPPQICGIHPRDLRRADEPGGTPLALRVRHRIGQVRRSVQLLLRESAGCVLTQEDIAALDRQLIALSLPPTGLIVQPLARLAERWRDEAARAAATGAGALVRARRQMDEEEARVMNALCHAEVRVIGRLRELLD